MINTSIIIPAIFNFIILFLVLRHFLFKPIMTVIETREKGIEDNINKAKEDVEKAKKLSIEQEQLLGEAKEEGRKIIELHKEKAGRLYEEIVTEAKKEASLLIERANLETEREREKARNELKKETVDLAIMFSAKALEESIDENKHRELINDFISKVGI